ncbi:uncharacterized protein LOC144302962 isoform X4 [Canis aureus]
MISVGLLDYMVTTFTCGRVSRECQDLPPGDLLSHQELLWKLCQTDPKVRYIIEKVCWEATKDYFDMCCCLHRGYLSSCPVFSDPCAQLLRLYSELWKAGIRSATSSYISETSV